MADALHFITCEYPPEVGGVSDFSRAIAEELAAAGASIHVWAPGCEPAAAPSTSRGVHVHRVCGAFRPRDLERLSGELNAFGGPKRLILHWVPHGYGCHAMNWQLCRWVLHRARFCGDHVELIVHEPGVAFERNLKQWCIAVVHRVMICWLLKAASRVWLSTPAWERRLRPWQRWAGRRDVAMRWLPLSIDLRVIDDASGVAGQRTRLTRGLGGAVLGHFGTYGEGVIRLLAPALKALLARRAGLSIFLMGRGSDQYLLKFLSECPEMSARIQALGEADSRSLSIAMQACDLFIQPYPDGITTRRSSALAVLAHGLAVVTTVGHLTEKAFWRGSGAVRLAPLDPEALAAAVEELISNTGERLALGGRGREFFRQQFMGQSYSALFEEG